MVVLIDAGHGENTAGKCSPQKADGTQFYEWQYARLIAERVQRALQLNGITAKLVVSENTDVTLKERCKRVNEMCCKHGTANCILVSIHVNAAGADGKWHTAGGWCAYTTRGTTKSDKLAECLYDAAQEHLDGYARQMELGKSAGVYDKRQRPIRLDTTDGDSDLEAGFYILKNTKCAAVLTENLFMDNEQDCQYLLTDEGKSKIASLHVQGIINYIKQAK